MPDLLIRNLSQEALDIIDHEASVANLPRNEFLHRFYENKARSHRKMNDEDWALSASRTTDLTDPDIMDAAWR